MSNTEERIKRYLNLGDGGFDQMMEARLVSYEEGELVLDFPTHKWQVNEQGAIHGGAIAGMFETGLGIMANVIAGEAEAVSIDMHVDFLRGIQLGDTCKMVITLVKPGRKLIRLRGELYSCDTGKLAASAILTSMPNEV